MTSLSLRLWRNWQTRKVQVLVAVRSWRFKSSQPHFFSTIGDLGTSRLFFALHLNMKLAKDEFDALALKQLDTLYRVALRLTHNPSAAEDLVQDTYYRAIRSRETFDMPEIGMRPWLVCILRNTFLSGVQRENRQPVARDDQTLDHLSQPVKSSPLLHLELNQQLDQELARAMNGLPEEYRTVLVLWALEDFTYQEIAEAMEVPIGTVMSRLHRARGKLAEQLHNYALREGYIKE